jgi:2-(1,2-epoxy-1,2-dihydrophenyl)acetyl-CoA isomerase
MSTPTAVAQRLYDAMAHNDGQALIGLLTEDFVGTVSTGMPHGVGGEHRGPGDMITDVWARIASVYDIHVDPLDYLQVDDARVVVLGRY